MCGIIGYTGNKPASPILIDGLRVMEYRGYDSAGLYVPGSGTFKAVGAVQALVDELPGMLPGYAGIGHTRWATHGVPSRENAHPHHDQSGKLSLVHNGIIENYAELREELIRTAHTFRSDTDSEVLAHLIGEAYEETNNLAQALTRALERVTGTYGIAVMHEDLPDTILVARMGSPIAIGVKEGEYIVASDTAPMLRHTTRVLYLEDGEYAILRPEGHAIFAFNHDKRNRAFEVLHDHIGAIQKGGYPHFMLKEINEVPETLENSARGRVMRASGEVKFGGLETEREALRSLDRILIVGCGSAFYAGLVGKCLMEDLAHLPADVAVGSELRHRPLLTQGKTALLAISQSGETADTLASIRAAKHAGLPTIGIVNVVGSTIARETDMGIYNHAGPEIGVASTKAFVSQLEVLTLFAVYLGRMRGLSTARAAEILFEMRELPRKVQHVLRNHEAIKDMAGAYLGYDDFLYIGRGYNMATAYEGALKLKEVSYVHAEGYAAGEMKHGPIAMVDTLFPTVAIMPQDSTYEKNRSSVEEIRARSGPVLALTTEGNVELDSLASDVLYVPDTHEIFTPMLYSVVLELFAYYTGVLRGFNVDRPRNLAKSVTVE